MQRFFRSGFNAVNSILRPLGLRLQRLERPTRTFRDFFEHVRRLGLEVRTVIDVGVATGTRAIYDAFPRAKYFLVEPVEEARLGILELIEARKLDADCLWVAAGSTAGTMEFNVHCDLSGSSALRQAEGTAADGYRRTVRMERLDRVIPAVERPLLLKVDTQGTEVDVLEGFSKRLVDLDLIIVETSLFAFRVGAAQFHEIVMYLAARGFVVYDILEGHTRPLDKALAQVDLVFVPQDSVLRRDQRFFSERQLEWYLGQYMDRHGKPRTSDADTAAVSSARA